MKLNEFKINFDMPIRGSNITIPMTATAELHHSEPYYVLRNIEIVKKQPGIETEGVFIRELKIKKRKEGHDTMWLHCDTGRESDLSRSAGRAIEEYSG